MSTASDAWCAEDFQKRLMEKEKDYHIFHPFHVAMHEGLLSREQIQGWVMNRFYYQINLPRKDAAILANCPDRAVRRKWRQRILDQDGQDDAQTGGIDAWVRLGEACGIDEDTLWSCKHVVPGVRFAVDAYVNFAKSAPWQEAACSSLTELFAPKIHKQRVDYWPEHYPWIASSGLAYFKSRIKQAGRDVEHGLSIALAYADTREKQERVLNILQFKLDILWSMLNAISLAYGFNCQQGRNDDRENR